MNHFAGKVNVHNRRKWSLMVYDIILILLSSVVILLIGPSSSSKMGLLDFFQHLIIFAVCTYAARILTSVYKQIWRFGGSSAYIRLMLADTIAGIAYYLLYQILPVCKISFIRALSLAVFNLLLSLGIRLVYQYLYDRAGRSGNLSGSFWKMVSLLTGLTFEKKGQIDEADKTKIRIAIVGAGNVGVLLADELRRNLHASYVPCCFVDTDLSKVGREIFDIPVLNNDEFTPELIASMGIQEIVFALPNADAEHKKALYDHYKSTGCKIKTYDYPVMQTAEKSRRSLREFDIEDLLFRQPIDIHNEKTQEFYQDKVVLITGGGGSIGSELCRQIAKMHPKMLIVLDICENGAYDIQQELKIAYSNKLDVRIEIVSICDRKGLEKVFDAYRPEILLHAAAHKHVPLMEHNCCEAIKNNVFGTLNVVELAEKYEVSRFIMVSTDKAVNPTNVMGATKRMCEMIVQSYSRVDTPTTYSATRFGNVLGSAGSVVPLFKRQIRSGGPLTITDKRIIRYFMTIPEASQLVLQSGALAKNGELFVLDMGNPVKILDLAESMIKLSGYEPYREIDIIETGLRPGEKLYEELLIRTEELDKTENSLIFIERDNPLTLDAISEKLAILKRALASEDDQIAREALKSVVPTFRAPEAVNSSKIGNREISEADGKSEKELCLKS